MRSLLLRRLGKTLRVLLYGSGASYLIACILLYLNQERLLFHPAALAHDFAYPFRQPYSETFLPVDTAVIALVHFSQPNPKGAVLYLHGNADTLQSAELFAERFVRRGYDVVLLDYRGYGKSIGRIASEDDLHRDVRAAYAYVRQRYREDAIILYGHSLGSGLAVRLAATTTPRMIILEAPYLSMQDLVAHKLPYFPPFLLKYPLRSDQWIGKVRCPIALFHGTQDGLIPYDSSERLRGYSTAQTQLTLIVGGGHADLPSTALYQSTLDQILR